jgi:hypothetical protein
MYDGRTRLGVLLIPDMVLLELPGPRAAGPWFGGELSGKRDVRSR